MSALNQTLQLPCGAQISNRLAKSAMSENMAKNFSPDKVFINLYEMWAQGGAGLLISGNVMIDSNHLGEPNNVVIENGLNNIDALKKWAESVRKTNAKLWLQLNHPGKQSPKFLNQRPVAPSAIPLSGHLASGFNTPSALTEIEIDNITDRFAYAALATKEAGFHGVQIHGAHGYLVSQFLSPRHNIRTDKYGGSIENRMRFVIEIYKKMRSAVGPNYPIGIKINSADFSKGGFSNQEAIYVAKTLSDIGIDLIEISGGSYEAPAMMGATKESTQKREAYFLDYTKEIKNVIACPLMVTGGFRTKEFMEQVVLKNEVDLVGLARPLALEPNFCNQILNNSKIENKVRPLSSGFRFLDKLFPLEIIWYTYQIHRMGQGKLPNAHASVYPAIIQTALNVGLASLKRMRA